MRDASWPAPAVVLLLVCAFVHGPVWASHLIVIANDGKEPHRDGSYRVLASPQPDSVVVLDASTFPPRVVAEISNVPNSNSGPPQSLCLTPGRAPRAGLRPEPYRSERPDEADRR